MEVVPRNYAGAATQSLRHSLSKLPAGLMSSENSEWKAGRACRPQAAGFVKRVYGSGLTVVPRDRSEGQAEASWMRMRVHGKAGFTDCCGLSREATIDHLPPAATIIMPKLLILSCMPAIKTLTRIYLHHEVHRTQPCARAAHVKTLSTSRPLFSPRSKGCPTDLLRTSGVLGSLSETESLVREPSLSISAPKASSATLPVVV